MLDPEGHKRKTAHNRESSPRILADLGFSFDAKNNGAHLVVDTADGLVDFWPGTGLWEHRESRRRGRGVFHLTRTFQPPAVQAPPPGEGLVIKRTPHMTDFAVKVYRDAGFTVEE